MFCYLQNGSDLRKFTQNVWETTIKDSLIVQIE